MASAVSAIVLSLLFLVAGLWKVTDAPAAAVRMTEALVPHALSLPLAIALGIGETFAGVLLLVPRFRRWGAILAALMLVVFMLYLGAFYNQLRGEECNCFPWVKRAVGPAFFIGDLIMLGLAVMAGAWAKRPNGVRPAALILSAVTVFALVSYGMVVTQQSGIKAPASITVDGKPLSLERGRVFVYFFDPECRNCLEAARRLAKMNWGDTKLVAVATQQPQFGPGFLQTTGFPAGLSPDVEVLQETLSLTTTPSAAAIENGHLKKAITNFEGDEAVQSLKELGFIH